MFNVQFKIHTFQNLKIVKLQIYVLKICQKLFTFKIERYECRKFKIKYIYKLTFKPTKLKSIKFAALKVYNYYMYRY